MTSSAPRCAVCDRPTPIPAVGRTPTTCSASCRAELRAWRQRRDRVLLQLDAVLTAAAGQAAADLPELAGELGRALQAARQRRPYPCARWRRDRRRVRDRALGLAVGDGGA